MAINSSNRYKLIFEEHRYAIEIRFRIIRATAWTYVVLGVAFVWLHENARPLSWTVPALATIFTLFMRMADFRNRSGIKAARDAGVGIERSVAAEIPENERYFTQINKEVSPWRRHGFVLDLFAIFITVLLVTAAWNLYISKGKLPTLSDRKAATPAVR